MPPADLAADILAERRAATPRRGAAKPAHGQQDRQCPTTDRQIRQRSDIAAVARPRQSSAIGTWQHRCRSIGQSNVDSSGSYNANPHGRRHGGSSEPHFFWRACSSIKTTAEAQHGSNATGVSFFGNGDAGVLLPSCRRPETESAPGLFHCRQQSPGNSAIIRLPPVESHCKSVTYNDWCATQSRPNRSRPCFPC